MPTRSGDADTDIAVKRPGNVARVIWKKRMTMSGAIEVDIQDAVAELFAQLLDEHGYEVFEREAMRAIAGFACPIYRSRGPDRLDAILQELPFAVENALVT